MSSRLRLSWRPSAEGLGGAGQRLVDFEVINDDDERKKKMCKGGMAAREANWRRAGLDAKSLGRDEGRGAPMSARPDDQGSTGASP
jgi:hypothetical protein